MIFEFHSLTQQINCEKLQSIENVSRLVCLVAINFFLFIHHVVNKMSFQMLNLIYGCHKNNLFFLLRETGRLIEQYIVVIYYPESFIT